MKYQKYFVIGYNKTATSSFHKLFLLNNIKSFHGLKWDLNSFDSFSDNGEYQNFKKISKIYPNSIFILNTRPLINWIISRFEHGEREKHIYYKNGSHWAYPTSEYLTKDWSFEREKRYYEILEYFKNQPDRLIIINIESPNWEKFISEKLYFTNHKIGFNNRHTKSGKNEHIKSIVDNTFKKFKLNPSNLLVNNEEKTNYYLSIYDNNILD